MIGVDLESSAGGNTTLCKVAFLTKETYSPANVTDPEQISSNGFTVIELGWFFDASDHRLVNPVGCLNLTDAKYYTREPSCVCEYGYLSGFGYSNCFCNDIGHRGNPYLPGGCIGKNLHLIGFTVVYLFIYLFNPGSVDLIMPFCNCSLDINECEGELGRSRCVGQTCVNVPGSFRCVPKETGKISPMILGEQMAFFF